MSDTRRAFLALGSNIGDRVGHLRRALERIPDLVEVSAVYETPPISDVAQDAFLNMVVRLDTALSPHELLDVCRECEAAADRVRVVHWGPRTLDVDVLWVDGETVDDPPDLLVPHPRMFERSFVLVPLADVGLDLLPEDYDVEAVAAADGIVRIGLLDELEAEQVQLVTHIVGNGRAGGAFAKALAAAGWPDPSVFSRNDSVDRIGEGADLVLLAVPDTVIADVARSIPVSDDVVVAHLSGATGLDALAPHPRVAGLHPLVSMADAETGAARLRGAWFAYAGDPRVLAVVDALGGRSFLVADEDRARYHAAAVVASNHLVAVLGQAERLAESAGVPFAAIMDLVNSTVANVAEVGPASALTGPAARGDEVTIQRHLDSLEPEEQDTYRAMAAEARRLAGRPQPDDS